MAKSPEELAHIEWLGYVQPIGLVVSIPAMLEAQCYINKNIISEHARFLNCLPADEAGVVTPEIRDLREFVQAVLGWEPNDLVDVPAREVLTGTMTSLEVVLPQYNETLRPTHAVPAFRPEEDQNPWLMLIQELPTGVDLDDTDEADSSRHWNAPPQAKFERLLRETGVPIGVLSNGISLRLVYSPRGETSGYATFNVDEMAQVAGRPMFAALHMLLNSERMFSMGDNQRLPAILANSRKYQNIVSNELAEQVLAALYELMRGFQAANDVRRGQLLGDVLARDPNQVYSGLLTVLMRLVFILYSEDRDLLSSDPIYSNHYSVSGLFNRLREEAGRFPDTMDQRFGAWSQLVTLFRLVYEGGQHAEFKLPPRKGYLFDPDRYPFLEGRKREGQPSEIATDTIASQNAAEDSAAVDITDETSETDLQRVAEATPDFKLSANASHASTDTTHSGEQSDAPAPIPRVSDGVVYRVLKNLLILNGERLSYRTLDVEQIGSVYETVMGFNLEVAAGKSIAIKPIKSHGAPATINLDELLSTPDKDRAKWLKEKADQTVGTADAKLLKAATNLEELLTALDKKIAKKVTPRVVPAGAIVLQPSDERRRSGSHYTPRSLTEPIVRTTLEPILKQLCDPEAPEPAVYSPSREDKRRYTAGELDARVRLSQKAVKYTEAARTVGTPHPSQILDLKICDPAMGSGAFLVETCRQLGDELIKAWYAHPDSAPSPIGRGVGGEGTIPPDEDEVLYARRLIAQRCLYGVDKNVMAVDLAKLSLWLVTLAKDHAFTFLDHALRHGDSLVGLTREQIIGFHWEVKKQKKFGEDLIQRRLDRATEARAKILNAREDVPYRDQQQRMASADEALDLIRLVGDACVSGFFAGQKKKEREEHAERLFGVASSYLESLTAGRGKQVDFESRRVLGQAAARLRAGSHPIPAFHWEIEFPEVFARENGGFDAFVGNPPFAGKNTLIKGNHEFYLDWLKTEHEGSSGNADLACHFFRKAFNNVRFLGTSGLIATKTIGQGDSRPSGLGWICRHGGIVYAARRRYVWPGVASVIVSIVHFARTDDSSIGLFKPCVLDNKQVPVITAYLFHAGGSDEPYKLVSNRGKSFQGVILLGMGFTFDDSAGDASANSIAEMERLLSADPKNQDRIRPYIGGEDVNDSPRHEPSRFVICFDNLDEDEARAWPELMQIVEQKVRPDRMAQKDKGGRERWWQFLRPRNELQAAIKGMSHVFVLSRVSEHLGLARVPASTVFSDRLVVFSHSDFAFFCCIQSRIHEIWARFFSTSHVERFAYMPTSCFETFVFPTDFSASAALTIAGATYDDTRNKLMIARNEGLTDTYNRFHDPHEQSEGILELRRLHGLMDGAVLRAYGWDDLAESARCEFLLDYEEEEDDADAGPPAAGTRKKSKKKKPWRLRWPDEFRDEVLARLLELNEQRHKEEQLLASGNQEKKKKTAEPRDNRAASKIDPSQTELF